MSVLNVSPYTNIPTLHAMTLIVKLKVWLAVCLSGLLFVKCNGLRTAESSQKGLDN